MEEDALLRGLIIASAKKSIFVAGADLKPCYKQQKPARCANLSSPGNRFSIGWPILKFQRLPPSTARRPAAATKLRSPAIIASHQMIRLRGSVCPKRGSALLPAWGGCTRLPRFIGAEKAAEVILKGKLYSAQEALKVGLVDEIAPPDQLLDRAREKLRAGKRKMEGGTPSAPGSQKLAHPKQRGNPAPERAYEIISKTLSISPDESLRLELDGIVELGKTESTQNLIRNFFLAEKYKKERRERRLKKSCTLL